VDGLSGLKTNDTTALIIKKDFGARKTIQLRAYVPELGISQHINLIIEPNIKISVSQPSSQNAKSFAGVPFYTGVFAETVYNLTVSMEYMVIEKDQIDNTSYAFFSYTKDDSEAVVTNSSKIVTIPTGSIVAGLICKIPLIPLLINLLPLIILSGIISVMLILIPKLCIKCFSLFGVFIKALSVIGIILAIFTFLTKIEIHESLDTLENAAFICVNACITLSGALPLMYIVNKLLKKPLEKLSSKININGVSALSLLASLVTNASTFGVMDQMDKKGVLLNSAFAVSASFVFGSHLAFTMAFDSTYVVPMIVGKLISGACALALALLIYKDKNKDAE
jgi:membrane protein CcdC involved in cytochrome C biogenesis